VRRNIRGTFGIVTASWKTPGDVLVMLYEKPATRTSTLATLDDAVTLPLNTSPGLTVVALIENATICGGASGARIGTGVGVDAGSGAGETGTDEARGAGVTGAAVAPADGTAGAGLDTTVGAGEGDAVCAALVVGVHATSVKASSARQRGRVEDFMARQRSL